MSRKSQLEMVDFGFPFEQEWSTTLAKMCNDLDLDVPHIYGKTKPKKPDFLWAVEKHYANIRVANNKQKRDYMRPGFAIKSYSIPKLRQIFTMHDVPFSERPTYKEFERLWPLYIEPIIAASPPVPASTAGPKSPSKSAATLPARPTGAGAAEKANIAGPADVKSEHGAAPADSSSAEDRKVRRAFNRLEATYWMIRNSYECEEFDDILHPVFKLLGMLIRILDIKPDTDDDETVKLQRGSKEYNDRIEYVYNLFETGCLKAHVSFHNGDFTGTRKLIVDIVEDLHEELSIMEAPEAPKEQQ